MSPAAASSSPALARIASLAAAFVVALLALLVTHALLPAPIDRLDGPGARTPRETFIRAKAAITEAPLGSCPTAPGRRARRVSQETSSPRAAAGEERLARPRRARASRRTARRRQRRSRTRPPDASGSETPPPRTGSSSGSSGAALAAPEKETR